MICTYIIYDDDDFVKCKVCSVFYPMKDKKYYKRNDFTYNAKQKYPVNKTGYFCLIITDSISDYFYNYNINDQRNDRSYCNNS